MIQNIHKENKANIYESIGWGPIGLNQNKTNVTGKEDTDDQIGGMVYVMSISSELRRITHL